MCGIAGAFAWSPSAPEVDREELLRIRDRMTSRGPDGSGLWTSENRRVALAHRRLAIIDLSDAAAQPMVSADGRAVIVFNGEIYNYRDLRRSLAEQGHRFRTESDTEVLLVLWRTRGEAMLRDLRGMFAFAIHDLDRRGLFLARDAYGIKPLYYADAGGTFRFASQVKALVAGGAVDLTFAPAGAVGYFLRGSIPEPFTMYRSIRMLPAGTSMWVDERGAASPRTWFSIAKVLRDAASADPLPERERAAVIHDALFDSVRHHLVADVPVGAFLSAGIDSTTVVSLAQEAGAAALQTMTLTFDEYRGRDNDESPLAALLASRLGLPHVNAHLTLDDFRAELPRIFEAMDQPTNDGMNSYFITRAAKELGLKVALSGAGGDELFGGYSSFRDLKRWVPAARAAAGVPLFGRAFEAANRFAARHSSHVNPRVSALFRYGATWGGAYFVKRASFLPEELPSLLNRDVVEAGLRELDPIPLMNAALEPDPGTPYGRVVALESSFYLRNQLLRDADWASMAHSVEVRVPLVDAFLLERVAPALVHRRDRGKELLARAPRTPLPDEILKRKKTGFTLPIREWLRAENPGGKVEFGKRSWARRVFAQFYSPDNGTW